MANAEENVVLRFDYSRPELCVASIKQLERELLSSRIGPDVFVGFDIDDQEVYLHVQRDNLYVRKFHLNDTDPWSIDKGGTLRTRVLGYGHSYDDLAGGVEHVKIGFPRFRQALVDIVNRFENRGAMVSRQKDTRPGKWDELLKNGLASLIVMAIEPCRSLWFNDDLGRFLIGEKHRTRDVTSGEGDAIRSWGKISGKSREDMGQHGWISRSCPIKEADATSAETDSIYARDFTTVRCLTT